MQHPLVATLLAIGAASSYAQGPSEMSTSASAALPNPACPNYRDAMRSIAFPREALAAGVHQATFDVQFEISPLGEVENVRPIGAAHPAFHETAVAAVNRFKCTAVGRRVTVRVPFAFKVE